MTEQWVKLAFGILVIIGSVFMIVRRDAVARWNAKSIKRMWGDLAEPVAKSSKPRTAVLVAIVYICIALVFVLTSIDALNR